MARIRARYQRLAREIAAEEMRADGATVTPRLWRGIKDAPSCERIRDSLESYIDAELSGEDAGAVYPETKKHLSACKYRRTLYAYLKEGTEE